MQTAKNMALSPKTVQSRLYQKNNTISTKQPLLSRRSLVLSAGHSAGKLSSALQVWMLICISREKFFFNLQSCWLGRGKRYRLCPMACKAQLEVSEHGPSCDLQHPPFYSRAKSNDSTRSAVMLCKK